MPSKPLAQDDIDAKNCVSFKVFFRNGTTTRVSKGYTYDLGKDNGILSIYRYSSDGPEVVHIFKDWEQVEISRSSHVKD